MMFLGFEPQNSRMVGTDGSNKQCRPPLYLNVFGIWQILNFIVNFYAFGPILSVVNGKTLNQ